MVWRPTRTRVAELFRYALLPHDGNLATSGTIIEAARLNRPLTPLLEGSHLGSRGPVGSFAGSTSVAITAIKRAEYLGTDLVVRAHETMGTRTAATIELPVAGRTIEAVFNPHQDSDVSGAARPGCTCDGNGPARAAAATAEPRAADTQASAGEGQA